MKRILSCFAALTGFALSAAVHADIIFTPSPGSNTGTDNVVFNPCASPILGPTLTVTGCLQSTPSVIVAFTGTENLTVNGGQARILAQDGAFDNLTIYLDPLVNSAFTALIFNVNTARQDSGTITIDVSPVGEPIVSQSFAIGAGQNFFRIDAINGELIQSVNFFSSGVGIEAVAFDDVRQVRIGGISDGDGGQQLPEPGALLLMGTVLAGVGLRGRARKPSEF